MKNFVLVLAGALCFCVLTSTDEPPEKDREIMGRGVVSLPQFSRIFNREEGKIKIFVHSNGKKRSEVLHKNLTSLTGLVDISQPIKVFIHGFMSHSGAEYPRNLMAAFRDVKQDKCNLLTVDWSCSDGTHTCNIPTDYCKIVRQIDSIGHKVGEFLAWIHDVLGVDGSTTELYGHSLGCHISGGAARQFRARMGTNISIIVGMDPAGPGFQGNTPMATPMSASDASNVVAIVTDGMFFGMASQNCTTVYLNGGGLRLQPRCKDLTSDFCGTCGHSSSHIYYTDSVYQFDGPFSNVSLPICADTPTETTAIFLGERVAHLKRDKYFIKFEGFSTAQSPTEARLLDSYVKDRVQSMSAALIDEIQCLPYFGHKLSFEQVPELKFSSCNSPEPTMNES